MKAATLHDIGKLENRIKRYKTALHAALLAQQTYKDQILNLPDNHDKFRLKPKAEYQSYFDECVRDRLDLERMMKEDRELLNTLTNNLN